MYFCTNCVVVNETVYRVSISKRTPYSDDVTMFVYVLSDTAMTATLWLPMPWAGPLCRKSANLYAELGSGSKRCPSISLALLCAVIN